MAWRDTIRAWFGGSDGAATLDLEERGLAEKPTPAVGLIPGASSHASAYGGAQPPFYPEKPVPPAPRPDARATIEAERKANADQRALGISGTANLMGFIQDLGEYNADMRGIRAMEIYEKMRRSSGTVAALEAAIRLPIRGAEWNVEPGVNENEPGYALAKQIAEDVQDNLMGGLESVTESGAKITQTFESVIENALLCAPFGCSAHEDLWAVDGDKVRLRGLAARLPRTFYQFITDADGETLKKLIQFGYRGALVQIAPVPAEKLCLFTLNREGAYFYGRSIFRAAYLHWFFVNQIYRLDVIVGERTGGVPTIKQGPNASPEDVAQSWQWVQNLSTNERTGLSLPYLWDFENKGVSGRVRDWTQSIDHHNEQILDAGLAGFLSLGKTATGSRSVGDVKLEFFLLSEQALANMIGEEISNTTIRRLVDFNYDLKPDESELYPKLRCTTISVLNVLDEVEAIWKAGNANVGWLNPDEDGVKRLRRRMGLPPAGKPIARWAATVVRVQEESQGELVVQPGEKETAAGTAKPAATDRAPVVKKAVESQPSRPPEAGSGKLSTVAPKASREPLPHEKKHNFQGHVDRADTTARQVARVLRQAKPELIHAVASDAARRDVTDVHHASATFPHALARRVESILGVAHRYGRDQVYAERYKATKRGKNIPPQAVARTSAAEVRGTSVGTVQAADLKGAGLRYKTLADGTRKPKPTVSFNAQATVSDFVNEISKRARARAIDLAKDGKSGEELEQSVTEDVLGASDGWIDRAGAEAARSAVADGRDSAFTELDVEIARYVRSEVMDQNTCDPCAEGDGQEWTSYDDIDWQPGDDCQGGDACRGQVIPVFEDEGVVVLE